MTMPVVRQISWPAIIPQIAILFAFIWPAKMESPEYGFLLGVAGYTGLILVLRYTIARHHRLGIRMVKRGRFREAIDSFQHSFEFFERYPWVDRFRSIFLLSASAMTYREMALANIAFSYSQQGDGEKARYYYEICQKEFPHNGVAIAALRLMDSVKKPIKAD